MRHHILYGSMAVVLLLPGFVQATEPVLRETFDRDEPGLLHRELARRDRLEVVTGEGVGGSAALKASYEGYDRGSRRLTGRFALSEPLQEATLCYDVKFACDFQFVNGGKLHGLGPKRPVTGGNPRQPDRWSARVIFARKGRARTYLYDQSKDRTYGIGRPSDDFTFERDRYHAVSLHMRVNAPGKANGFAHIYVDGERVVTHDDVAFRGVGNDETLIHQFIFSTFHGGNAPRWAPFEENGEYTTVHAFFDNFAVYPGRSVRDEPSDDLTD